MTATSQEEYLEKRQNRLEAAIERMTDIASDLNKMIAVHEQRITSQDKQIIHLDVLIEKQKVEFHANYIELEKKIDQVSSQLTNNINDIKSWFSKAFWIVAGFLIVQTGDWILSGGLKTTLLQGIIK